MIACAKKNEYFAESLSKYDKILLIWTEVFDH
jgi:hypothetical protein